MAKGKRNRDIRKLAYSINPSHVKRVSRRIRKNRTHNHDVTKEVDRPV